MARSGRAFRDRDLERKQRRDKKHNGTMSVVPNRRDSRDRDNRDGNRDRPRRHPYAA